MPTAWVPWFQGLALLPFSAAPGLFSELQIWQSELPPNNAGWRSDTTHAQALLSWSGRCCWRPPLPCSLEKSLPLIVRNDMSTKPALSWAILDLSLPSPDAAPGAQRCNLGP